MKRGRLVSLFILFFAAAAFVTNLIANCSDRWWVNAREGGEKTFRRAGLWQVCFDMYRHRFDYYGKIYNGCWWLFSPEIRMLRSWISNYWLRWVQTLSTLSLICSLFALGSSINVNRQDNFRSARHVLIQSSLHIVAALLMFCTVILFGVDGKRRDWMMNWQFNWFGWSYKLAIVSCILQFIAGIFSIYQGSNKYLLDMYDFIKEEQKLEKLSTLKFPPLPHTGVVERNG
ncbi:unnamed protein product, partial [Didymodactylos carnosus]